MSLGAFTTTFTPPASCAQSNENTYATKILDPGGELKFHLVRGPLYSDGNPCFPSDYSPDVSSYYSPGFCPSGYTPAQSSSALLDAGVEETTIVCCPSGRGISYQVTKPSLYFESSLACRSPFKSLSTTVTFVSHGTTLSTGVTAETRRTGAVNAHGYQIRFRAHDLQKPASVPASTTPSTPSSSHTSPSDSQSQGHTDSGGLSSGAAAGIGIGVTIALLILVAVAFFFGRRSMQRRKQAQIDGDSSGNYNGQETQAMGDYGNGQQGPGYYMPVVGPVEIANDTAVRPMAELYSDDGGAGHGRG